MLALAFAFVRVWTSLYTIGMPPALAAARRAEIESDLWEFQHALAASTDTAGADSHRKTTNRSIRRSLAASVHVLVRLLLGVPDDLLWRAELMDLRSRRRRASVWIATALAIVVTGLWLRESRQPTDLPQIPLSPIKTQAWLTKPIPPPPPPPPPPGYRPLKDRAQGGPARAIPPPTAPRDGSTRP